MTRSFYKLKLGNSTLNFPQEKSGIVQSDFLPLPQKHNCNNLTQKISFKTQTGRQYYLGSPPVIRTYSWEKQQLVSTFLLIQNCLHKIIFRESLQKCLIILNFVLP